MPTPSPLEYAPRPPMHRRRRFRWIVTLLLVLGFLMSGWLWGPSGWQRLQLLYWQHKCLTYTQRPGTLVFDSKSGTTFTPREWQEFYSRYSPPGMQSAGTIFLGEMKSPSGNRRFVAIDVLQGNDIFRSDLSAYPRVFQERSGSLRLVAARRELRFPLTESGKVTSAIQVYSGRVDSADPSHVIFSTAIDGARAKYDVWLQDDDSVVIGQKK